MDTEREFKRLRKLVVRCFLGALILILIAVFWGSYQLKNLKSQIATKEVGVKKEIIIEKAQPVYGINGLDGHDGVDGRNGVDGQSIVGKPGTNGNNGKDGQSITAEQIASAVAAYLKANPPAAGAQGPPGRTLIVQINQLTGLTQCKWLGDEVWQPISECSQ